jgi:hypothetical protein
MVNAIKKGHQLKNNKKKASALEEKTEYKYSF